MTVRKALVEYSTNLRKSKKFWYAILFSLQKKIRKKLIWFYKKLLKMHKTLNFKQCLYILQKNHEEILNLKNILKFNLTPVQKG